ncbi:MAG TPA: GNAT family N-acetyltransferase [Candidatus Sulfotelmatobacter sp.]|nr:GNAT family N-acetyltransferase [Candidatus Sulfotelmatobacter sp.]
MNAKLTIRAAEPQDEAAWRALWAGYCAFYEVTVSERVTGATWARILDPASGVAALVALAGDGRIVGFANYVVHPYTWGTQVIGYLEDLFVAPDARGRGAGKALIDGLIVLGERAGWDRVYWHTRENNAAARRVYDGFAAADDFVRYVVPIATR